MRFPRRLAKEGEVDVFPDEPPIPCRMAKIYVLWGALVHGHEKAYPNHSVSARR